jgi:hypothetical protein
MKMMRKVIGVAVVLTLMLVGLVFAAPAQAANQTIWKVQNCYIHEYARLGSPLWEGYIYLRVPWEVDGSGQPLAHVNAAYNPPGPLGPGISISNYTNRDVDVYYIVYTSSAGLSGQYQATMFLPGNGNTVYPTISNAMWYPNPPSHWLPWLNNPRIGISFVPHNQPASTPPGNNDFDAASCINYAPEIV